MDLCVTPGQQVAATEALDGGRRQPFGLAVWLVIAAGVLLRIAPVLQADFPSGDGGLAYASIRDLMANGFAPALTVSYNGTMSFPYPFLAFELVAVVSSITGIDPLPLIRILPPLLSALSIVAFAWLARELLDGRRLVLVATFFFATLPAGYQASIQGGGITRALATVLVLVALYVGVRAFRMGGRGAYLWCGVLIGLAQLAHPDGGLASAIGLLFLLLLVGPSRSRILGLLAVGLVALAVSALWWLRVVIELSPETLLSAVDTAPWRLSGLTEQASQLLYSSGLPLLAAALAVAVFEAVVHPSRVLLALGGWALAILVLDQRNASMDVVVPAALLAAAGLESFLTRTWPKLARGRQGPATRQRRAAAIVAAVLAVVSVAMPFVVPGAAGPRDQLRPADIDVMDVVSARFAPGTRFLLVTGSKWHADGISEWFPALTGAVSVVTPQGTEWHGEGVFRQTVEDHAAAQDCAGLTMSCLDAWSAATHLPFDAIYVAGPEAESSRQPQATIPELLGLVPTVRSDCCGPLRASLLADSRWNVIHNGPGAIIAMRTGRTPTPPSGSRPFPAPVTTRTVSVPTSIDATGSSDVSAALNAFIKSVPDGSIIAFRAGSTYRLDQGIALYGRRNLVFEGNGATLRANNPGGTWMGGPFNLNSQRTSFGQNSHIAIRNFNLLGSNPNTTTLYGGGENQHGVGIWGGTYIEVTGNQISKTYGDGVYVSGNDDTHASADSVWVHDNTFTYVGRMGIALTAGTNVLVEGNSFDKVGMHVLDLEPDWSYQANAYVTFRNNSVGSYGHASTYVGFLLASNGAAGTAAHDVTVTGNTVTGNPRSGYDGSPRGLNTYVTTPRQRNIRVTDNTTTMAARGPVLYFAGVDGVTVTGNRQPLVSGSQALFSNCTGVVHP